MRQQASQSPILTLVASPLRSLRLLGFAPCALTLSQRFLIAAVLVVAIAMAAPGKWIGVWLQQGITNGVATTAAASIDSLVARQIGDVSPGRLGLRGMRFRVESLGGALEIDLGNATLARVIATIPLGTATDQA